MRVKMGLGPSILWRSRGWLHSPAPPCVRCTVTSEHARGVGDEAPVPSPDTPMAGSVQQQELHKLLPLPFCARSSVRLDLGLIS